MNIFSVTKDVVIIVLYFTIIKSKKRAIRGILESLYLLVINHTSCKVINKRKNIVNES